MTSAGDEELKLALEALTASIPIITLSKVANAKAGEYIIAHLDCGCRFSEQRQRSKSRTTLLECVRLKSYVRNTNTKGTTRITTPRGAAVAIERRFCSPDYEAKHADAKIQKVVVTFIEASEIPRDVRAPKYDRLVGQQSAFSCAPPPRRHHRPA